MLSAPLGERLPALSARIHYTGTGRLRGRWEVVRPGEEHPADRDLLGEAALPAEDRRTQRRYMEVERFDVLLPPGGPFILEGPGTESLPVDAPGMYLVLLRLESTDDKESESNIGAAGPGLVTAGSVAGFPIPPLRYVIGDADAVGAASEAFGLLSPADGAPLGTRAPAFSWRPHPNASFTRLEIVAASDSLLLQAVLPRGVNEYVVPLAVLRSPAARWRAVALAASGRPLQATPWRVLHNPSPPGDPQ